MRSTRFLWQNQVITWLFCNPRRKTERTIFGIYTIEMTLNSEMIDDEKLFKIITSRNISHMRTSMVDSVRYVDDISHLVAYKDKNLLKRSQTIFTN